MDERIKQAKDRARAQKALRGNPHILKIMLQQAFGLQGTSGCGLRKTIERFDKRKSYLGTSLAKLLVGWGYVRPVGPRKNGISQGYSLTKKGLAYLLSKEEEINHELDSKRKTDQSTQTDSL